MRYKCEHKKTAQEIYTENRGKAKKTQTTMNELLSISILNFV